MPAARFSLKNNLPQITLAASSRRVINSSTSAVTAPVIRYQSPKTYLINQTITALIPTNTGGIVPAATYGKIDNFGGPYNTNTGVAVDAEGSIFTADWGTNQIFKLTPLGQQTFFAGSPVGSAGFADGQGTAALFAQPDALICDPAGNIYVADQTNNMIRKITPGGLVTTLAGNPVSGSADGTGAAASFFSPRGMALDNAGNLFVADQGNNLIRKVTPAGVVTTYAGVTSGGFTNGPRLSAKFSTPTAVEIDAAGNLYVSDGSNNAIRKIDVAGNVTTFVTGLNFPRELRIDGTGNIYVLDQYSNSLKRISPTGGITIVVGYATIGSGGTGFLTSPVGLVLDGIGNLYIGDANYAKKVVISGYTIDKALPPGLTFDATNGHITGTPTSLWPLTDYRITAYNGGGSNTTTLSLQVLATVPKQPSVITLPSQVPNLDANNNYNPGATSTNDETPITYTSSNPAVAVPNSDGTIHVIAPGVTVITASQVGNANFEPAVPVSQTLTVVEYLSVALPAIATKKDCDADFSVNATTSNATIPLIYTSSNTAVATISSAGLIHIVGVGSTTITVSQNASPPLYVSATPQSQTLTVAPPVLPTVTITAVYDSPCLGSLVTFTASVQNSGAVPFYQWQVNGTNAGFNSAQFAGSTFVNGDIITCQVTNNNSACLATYSTRSAPVTIVLATPQTPAVSIVASINSVLAGTPITFTATAQNAVGDINYQWLVNGVTAGTNSSTFTDNAFTDKDVVTCTITPAAQCSIPAVSNAITVTIVEKVTVPNTFTPNGDGINDLWNIAGLATYSNSVVSIFNRYGEQIFQSKGYSIPWNGTINGKNVPPAIYYYIIDLGDKRQKLSGKLTVLR